MSQQHLTIHVEEATPDANGVLREVLELTVGGTHIAQYTGPMDTHAVNVRALLALAAQSD
jgi:hypothetical protein